MPDTDSTAELAQLWAVQGSALPARPPALMAPNIHEARESLSWNPQSIPAGLKPISSPTAKHFLSYADVSVLRNVLESEKISCRLQF